MAAVGRGFGVAALAIASALSLFLWRDADRADRVRQLTDAEFRPMLAAPLPRDLSPRLLEAWSDRALELPSLSDAELDRIGEAVARNLVFRPQDPDLLNRLAWLEWTRHGHLGPKGAEALRSSLELAPFGDAETMRWRLALADAAWSALDGASQRASLAQIEALAVRAETRAWLAEFAASARTEAIRAGIAAASKPR